MATITLGNIAYNIVYVDPSIGVSGDGMTPATAVQNLPVAASLVSGTCYLIRRTPVTNVCTVPDGTSTVTQLVLLGMPKPSDDFYDLVPAEAQTAWGADSDDYANVCRAVNGQKLTLSSGGIHFIARRLYCHTANNITTNNAYMFTFTNNSQTNKILFADCKFGTESFDLSTTQVSVPPDRANCYISIQSALITIVRNCIIHFSCSSSYWGIWSEHTNRCYYTGITAYVTTGNPGGGMLLGNTEDTGWTEHTEFSDINIEIKVNGTQSYCNSYSKLCYTGFSQCAVMKNINIVETTLLGPSAPSRLGLERSIVVINNAYTCHVENVNIQLPYCAFIAYSSYEGAMRVDLNFYRLNTVCSARERTFKNVNIEIGSELSIGASNTFEDVTEPSYYHMALYARGSGDAGCNPLVMENVRVYFPKGKAADLHFVFLRGGDWGGHVCTERCVVELDSLTTWFPGSVLHPADNSNIKIGTLTVNRNNATYPFTDQAAIAHSSFGMNSIVYVGSSNSRLATDINYTTNNYSNLYSSLTCANEIEEGNYVQRTMNFKALTWGVNRTGGAPASIRFSNNSTSSNYNGMAIGKYPAKGFQVTPPSVGKYMLVAHVAFKNMVDPENLLNKFQIEAQLPINADGTAKRYSSAVDGKWEVDNSEWNNDTDLTTMQLSMPVECEYVAPIYINILFNWYSATGYLYLDPVFSLIAL